MSDKSDESVMSDKAIQEFFDGKDYDTSSDSELTKTDDKDQIIGVGDIIEFYHEGYTYGHKFSHPWAQVNHITTPEDGYIRTDFPYSFTHETQVRIVKKQNKRNKLIPFKKGKKMYLYRYYFKEMTSKEKEDREKAKNHRGPKRKYIHAENIPLPKRTITANNRRSQRIRMKSTKHTSSVNAVVSLKEKGNSLDNDDDNNMESEVEIESFFGKQKKGKITKSSMPTVLVIGMVLNRALSTNTLNDIPSTNARDLIRCLAIEKFYKCNVLKSIALDKGGYSECIPNHEQIDVSNHRSLKPFAETNQNSYDFVYIDYYRANDAYLSEHMLTESFFSKGIKLLWNTMKNNGAMYIPFLPGVVSNMIASLPQIKSLYNINYIRNTDLDVSDHFLWRASQKIVQHDIFNQVMSYEPTKLNVFGGVTSKMLHNNRS